MTREVGRSRPLPSRCVWRTEGSGEVAPVAAFTARLAAPEEISGWWLGPTPDTHSLCRSLLRVPEASRPWLRPDRDPDRVPCVGRSQRISTTRASSAHHGPDVGLHRLEYRLGTKLGYWYLAGVAKSARAEDLEKRICRMARKTLHPAPAVSFFPSSIDLGLYVTGTSTI